MTTPSTTRPKPADQVEVRLARVLRRARSTLRHERGSATTFVITAAAALFSVLLTVQFAVWAYAQHVAEGAARQAAEQTAIAGHSPTHGQVVAAEFTAAASGWLSGETITVTKTGEITRTEVHATAIKFVPVPWSMSVTGTAEVASERFVRADQR